MKTLTFAVCCLVAALFLVPQAQAQSCPANITNPLELINGQTWVFQTRAADYGPPGMASVGFFRAQFVATPTPRGVLTVTESVNGSTLNGVPPYLTRLANIPGKYQVYPDCSGGQLSFNLNQQAVQWEFVFANGFTQMYMTSQSLLDNPFLTKALRGIAVLGAPEGCPAGMDPLQVLSATEVWSFHSESAAFEGSGSARVGTFSPLFVPAGADPRFVAPHGILSATESISYNGIPTAVRLAKESGRYSVYPDCSGGILQINGAQPVTYDFVFVGADFTRIFMLSDTVVANRNNAGLLNPFEILAGSARSF